MWWPRRPAVLAVSACIAVGCGAGPLSPSEVTGVGPDGIPLMVGQLGCDDGGDCPATVAFSGTLYFVGGAEVPPGLVGELLAKRDESVPLEILARFGQARAVRGVAPEVLIALGPYRLGGEATEGEERWVWASPIFGDGDSRLTVALCAVVVDATLDC